MLPRAYHFQNGFIHILAACLTMYYAWNISQTMYLRSGLQFISPVLVILGVHLIWLLVTREWATLGTRGLYRRSTQTAVGMVIFIGFADSFLPMPAHASNLDDAARSVLTILFCGAIIAIVLTVFVLGLRLILYVCKTVHQQVVGRDASDNDNKINEMGSLVLVLVLTLGASFEDIPGAFQFERSGQSQAKVTINAPAKQVWQVMQTATSPKFPLPNILQSFPKPVEVVTDGGVTLGAIRQVKFEGREGAGLLTLQVVERTDDLVRFEVISDTSSYEGWIAYTALSYKVTKAGNVTHLSVILEYDRRLAPAWFFAPLMKGAAYLAMDVLGRDVKQRAESDYSASL